MNAVVARPGRSRSERGRRRTHRSPKNARAALRMPGHWLSICWMPIVGGPLARRNGCNVRDLDASNSAIPAPAPRGLARLRRHPGAGSMSSRQTSEFYTRPWSGGSTASSRRCSGRVVRPSAADHSERALEDARPAAARDSARARAGAPAPGRPSRADLRARRDRALLVEPRLVVGPADRCAKSKSNAATPGLSGPFPNLPNRTPKPCSKPLIFSTNPNSPSRSWRAALAEFNTYEGD